MTPDRTQLISKFLIGKKLLLSIMALVVMIVALLFAIHETTKATVTIVIGGEEQVIATHAKTVGEMMSEHDWTVNDHDKVVPALDSKISGNMIVNWTKAKKVIVKNNDTESEIWTTATEVSELLTELNITVGEHDLIKPSLQSEIKPEMNVTYETAFLVRLNSDGEQHEVWTTSTTVADFLEKESISLGELDRVEPAQDERIANETEVSVIRVEKVTDVVEEEVAFATVTRQDKSLERGKEEVLEQGSKGLVKKHYEVVLENGKEVSRNLVKTDTVKESSDRIVAVGTRQVAKTVSRSQSPVSTSDPSDGKTLTVTATAYTADCSGCSGVTSTGINLKNNRSQKVIAVDPDVIPLGSRVHVEGYGTAIAGDTGSAIQGNRIDVHVPTKADASRWGRKQVTITILD